MLLNKEQVSLTCRSICESNYFKEQFKVLKQISGRIHWGFRRWYRYCSTCAIWISGKTMDVCFCCNNKLRSHLTKRELNKRYYLKYLDKIKKYRAEYYQKHKERLRIKHRDNARRWRERHREESRAASLRYYHKKRAMAKQGLL